MATIKELIDALRPAEEILQWLRWERESLEDFHAYARTFHGTPGSNVFTFVLEDALRQRGLTLEQFRAGSSLKR